MSAARLYALILLKRRLISEAPIHISKLAMVEKGTSNCMLHFLKTSEQQGLKVFYLGLIKVLICMDASKIQPFNPLINYPVNKLPII